VGGAPLQDRPADQPFLRLAHEVLRLRLDERLFNQDNELATADPADRLTG